MKVIKINHKKGQRPYIQLVEYVNWNTKVCIICPNHGEFWQTPQAHISGKEGCPKCANEFRGKYLKEQMKTL